MRAVIFIYERDGYTVNNDTRASAVKKDVEDSLRRMGIDYLDSVIVHYVCGSFPVEETVGALENLVREGKIRTYGLLTVSRQICLHIRKPAETYLLYRNFSVFSLLSMAENILICVKKYNTVFQTMVCWRKDFNFSCLYGP